MEKRSFIRIPKSMNKTGTRGSTPRSIPGADVTNELLDISNIWKSQIIDSFKKEMSISVLDAESMEELQSEITLLRSEVAENNKLLKISNDLILQLVGTLNLQQSQAYFWTEDWLNEERNAELDIQNNDVVSFDNADDIIAFLHNPD
jgi:hypothetical protein